VIADDYTLVGVAGVLRKQAGHRIDPTYLAYRRDRYLRGRAEES
jgi:hypothetical protein